MKNNQFYIMLCVIFCSLCASTFAEERKLDSLQNALSTTKENSSKIAILNNLANLGIEINNFDTALYFAREALLIAEKVNDRPQQAEIWSQLGNIYYLKANSPEAINCYSISLKIKEKLRDSKGKAENYNQIAAIYADRRNDSLAIENYLLSQQIWGEEGDKKEVALTFYHIADIYLKQREFQNAEKNFLSALNISREIDAVEMIGQIYIGLGKNQLLQKNFMAAIENFKIALGLFEKHDNNQGIISSYVCLGNTYVQKGEPLTGKEWLAKSLDASKKVNNREALFYTYQHLASADSAIGNFKDALEHFKMYKLYRDSLFNKENSKRLIQAETQYEFDKKQAAAQMEQEKKDIKQRNFRNTMSAGFVGALIFLVVVYRQRNKISKARKRSDDLLLNILPQEVADELKETGASHAKQFDEVTILFTDFVHFTQTAQQLTPKQLVKELHECFTAFDEIIERNGLEKIKTVGDAYLAVCGLPISDPYHAQNRFKPLLKFAIL